MIYVSLLSRKITRGYSIYLRYYCSEKQAVLKSETLNLVTSQNYYCENPPNRIVAKDKPVIELAEKILLNRKAEILQEKFDVRLLVEKKVRIDLMAHIERIVQSKNHRTYDSMLIMLKKFVATGGVILNLGEFQDYMLNNSKLTQTSVSVYAQRLIIVLNQLKKEKLITFDSSEYKLVKPKPKPIIYLSSEDVKKIIEAEVDEKYLLLKYAYLFSCFTGLRRSDIRQLEWQMIDDGAIKITTIKTESQEGLPLSETANAILEYVKSINKEKNIFPIPISMFRPGLIHIAEKAGINTSIRFHSSRHTFGTLLAEQGIDIYMIKKLMTHKNIQSTMIYAHLTDSAKRGAVKKLPNFENKFKQ